MGEPEPADPEVPDAGWRVAGGQPQHALTHLRKLQDAGYVTSDTTGNGRASRTSLALTPHGRAALNTYSETLRQLLDSI